MGSMASVIEDIIWPLCSERMAALSNLLVAIGKRGTPFGPVHSTIAVSLLSFAEKEKSRGRQSWAERREGDCEARLGVLQEAPSKAEES